MGEITVFGEILERLLTLYTSEDYSEEILNAKVDFFERSTPSFSDDSGQFNLRMTQFLDWYLFTRKLRMVGLTPVQFSILDKSFPRNKEDKELLNSLLNTEHSVYEFIKIKGKDIYIRDLFSGKQIVVKDSPVDQGFNANDLFSVRLVPYRSNYIFMKGFCFHPVEARDYILKEIKKNKEISFPEKETFLLKLLRMRNKVEQYKHILPKYIYTNENAFRG